MKRKVDSLGFDENIPSSMRKELIELFKTNAYIIPDWCSYVHVAWEAEPLDDSNNIVSCPAYTSTEYPYRKAVVKICPSFIDEDDFGKDHIVKHELGHIITSPLVDYIENVLGMLDLEESTESIIKDSLQTYSEAVTQDLTNILKSLEGTNDNK